MMVGRQLTNWRKRLGVGILSRAVFSLALAAVLWGWVTSQDDPVIDQQLPPIAPTIVGRADDLVILNEGTVTAVAVTVRGPRSEVERLTAADLRVTVDLGEVKAPGSISADVQATVTGPRAAKVEAVTPQAVAITVDRLVARSFPLEIEPGQAIPPYSIANVTASAQRVEVRGSASVVERVARVVLPVNLGDRRDNFEAPFTPEARDAAGARLGGVTIEPTTVNATVTVQRVGRTVSIVPNIQGAPAEGFRVVNPRVSPPSVTVDGPPEALAQLIVVSTAAIDVTGRRESYSVFDVALNLPPGTRVVDRNTINVEVPIEAELQRQQIGGVRVNSINLEPGLRVAPNGISPSEIIVALSGPRDRIRQLNAGDVQAQIDLRGLGVGTHPVTPAIVAPPDLRVDPPQLVQVRIERIPATPTITTTPPPTATPTPPPTPTPTPPPATPVPSGRRGGEGSG